MLVWAPLASGAYRGWPLAIAELLALVGVLLCVLGMLRAGRLEWRRTALDLPLGLLVALVLVQLAVGNGAMAAWALAPAPADLAPRLPARFLLGTVAPDRTARALRLFLTYAAVYALVVNVVRTRARLDRLVRTLLVLGGVLAFAAIVERLTGDAWLSWWRDAAPGRRLAGTFPNPDHFAAWLEMLICLGVGYSLARSASAPSGPSLRRLLRSREGRERAIRRHLPALAVVAMALALALTLSRGGVLSLLAALAALLALAGARGQARRSLVVVGTVLAVTLAYGAWIGFGPLVERFRGDPYASRLTQLVSSLPMLAAFPLLGAGLGAYLPGKVHYAFAHNDLLQLAIELGPVGAALCALAGWRAAADLVGAHLLGRARCLVGGGERGGARRTDGWSVGIGLGACAAAIALVVHSAFDFSARIPANGILGAACLGLATVALHTRFGHAERLLTEVRARPLGPSGLGRGAAAIAAVSARSRSRPAIRTRAGRARACASGWPGRSGTRDRPRTADRSTRGRSDAARRWRCSMARSRTRGSPSAGGPRTRTCTRGSARRTPALPRSTRGACRRTRPRR
jgi:hypothetical protein